MRGNGSKNKSMNKNKIIIRQQTLIERILSMCSCIFVTFLPIIVIALGYDRVFEAILIFLFAIAYDIFSLYRTYRTYICVDITNDRLIICEAFNFKKETFYLGSVVRLKIVKDSRVKGLFTIVIQMSTYSREIRSWSYGITSRISVAGYFCQVKRLLDFCEECNEYLNNR